MTRPWANEEVRTFLSLVAEDRVQRELDGATRNERVFQEIAQRMSTYGYRRTFKQCREKLKKLKSNYRALRDNNNKSGLNRKTWKWFETMDSIYGSRRLSRGKEEVEEDALEAPTPLIMPSQPIENTTAEDSGTVSRVLSIIQQLEERNQEWKDQLMAQMIQEMRETRAQAREHHAENCARETAFNASFLSIMADLVKVLDRRQNQ